MDRYRRPSSLKPITAFFGTNSSGKTSLLQSLVLLKQTAEASDRRLVFHYGGNGSAVDFGDYGSLAKGNQPLEVNLDWETKKEFQVRDWRGDQRHTVAESTDLGFDVRVAPGKPGAPEVVQQFAYRVGTARFGLRRGKGKAKYDVFVAQVENFLTQARGRPYLLSAPVKCYGFPAEARARYTNADFMNDLESGLEQQLDLVRYLGPLARAPGPALHLERNSPRRHGGCRRERRGSAAGVKSSGKSHQTRPAPRAVGGERSSSRSLLASSKCT